MKKISIFLLSFSLFSTYLMAQPPTSKLAAHYCFDNCNDISLDCGEKSSKAQASPIPPKCVCGVAGNAIQLTGNEYINMLDVAYKLNTSNISVSLYFKPLGSVGVREIISNRDTCDKKRVFSISYNASARTVSVLFKDEKRSVTLVGKIDNDVCWQHIAVTRESNYHRLWINGKQRDAKYSPDNQRVNLQSNSILVIGKSACHPTVPGGQFRGLIDEVRIYENIALNSDEIQSLYVRPDRIKTNDQLLFIGNDIKTEVTTSCANKFDWSPTTGVLNPSAGSTTIKPDKAGVFNYVLRFNDSISTCAAYDTLRITVVDPKNQPCDDVFMPNAFTPNGDENNQTFGISNPYTIGELIEFEILDRWGGKIFTTKDPFVQWDGTVSGNLVMPGQYLYRVRYNCQGKEKNRIGSFLLLQ